MTRLARGLTVSAGAGAATYVGFAAWAGFHRVGAALARFSWTMAAAGLALASLNYLFRFAKWEYFLRRLDVKIPASRSLAIFLSGFSLTVTPGKVGEVLKSYLLRETDGVPMARTAPIVIAERVSDLIALILLAVVGAGALGDSTRILWIGGAMVAALIAAVAVRPIGETAIALVAKLPAGAKVAPKLREFYQSTRHLLSPAPLTASTAISLCAWACECLAFFVILRGFDGTSVGLLRGTFIYAAMTIAGALSFLPGGLGVTEGGMVALLVAGSAGLDQPTAFAATFVTRLCTLWFAVLLGVVALAFVQGGGAAVDLAALERAKADKDTGAVA